MGRPLKIRKYDNTNGGQVVDDGFPNNGNTDNGYDDNEPGIVGGVAENTDQIRCHAAILIKGLGTITADTANTTVTGTGTHFTTDAFDTDSGIWIPDGSGDYVWIGAYNATTSDTELELDSTADSNVTASSWYYVTRNAASIVRQKGARKFLVAGTDSTIQDESIATGQTYMINSVSNTDWQALGAGPDANQYKIFTATADGTGLTTNGTVWPVSTCLLVDDSNPTDPNTMSVAIYDDGSTYYASRIKNKFTIDFTDNGTDENPGVEYIATFFNDNGDVDPATGKTITGTENWC